jgi:hypothetical protein
MIDRDDLRFLESLARDVVEASRVRPDQRIGESPANSTGDTLIRPGGRTCYPAMWVRDFSMSLDSLLITPKEAQHHLALIARCQNGPTERKLKSGGIIPPFAIPDHINFDGGAVFYPGTMSAGDDQGGEPFGILPSADDHYEFIHIAHHPFIQRKLDLTARFADGLPLRDSLIRAFHAVETDESTGGMVRTTAPRRFVGFGFCDTVYLTGLLLFPSLLRHRAALELAAMLQDATYTKTAAGIADHLVPIFSDVGRVGGWLVAATEVGRQPDVWGTLYALHRNLLPPDFAAAARDTVADAVRRGTIVLDGGVRHVPTDHDFSPAGAWEKVAAGVALNTYQNGAYWHTPSGWLIAALWPSHRELAQDVLRQYIGHLREQDFRRGQDFGAPWECFGRDGAARQNAVYMTSVTVPLGVIRQLFEAQ